MLWQKDRIKVPLVMVAELSDAVREKKIKNNKNNSKANIIKSIKDLGYMIKHILKKNDI